MGRKHRLANRVAGMFGLHVARRGSSWRLVEPDQLQRFLKHFAVDCVFDVGANEGQYAAMLREIGYAGLIVSFEPNPTVAAIARARASRDPRWIVNEVALDSSVRRTEFNVMAASQFSSLRTAADRSGGSFVDETRITRKVSIETVRLDDIFASLQQSHGFDRPFLKLDTQGHDVEVVKGAVASIDRFVGLQSELALSQIYADAPDYHSALLYYRELGFRLSGLIPNNAGHFPDLHEVDCLMYNPAFL